MGGVAVVIDWEAPSPPDLAQRMVDIAPHRATAGVAFRSHDQATLVECSTARQTTQLEVTTAGPLSIAGDLRLWNTDPLVACAGGSKAARHMDDRHLLLAAYARTGIGFLDAVDGDFAFAIWNAADRSVLAVRDRFGTKPLFYQRSATGIRFASEIKQLITVSDTPVTPCSTTVAEFLTDHYRETDLTFFDGIQKVRPAEYVAADKSGFVRVRYWKPSFRESADLRAADVPHLFREQLIASVQRRLDSSHGTTMHVTGGLDSSSITAAATYLPDLDTRVSALHTTSAVFPGQDGDESHWINDVVARQPFSHHDFEPEPESLERFADVMWNVDSPLFNRIADLWPGTSRMAAAADSDLVLMGSGGDEVLDQSLIMSDLLRSRAFGKWWNTARLQGSGHGGPLIPLLWSTRSMIPAGMKRLMRKALRIRTDESPTLVRTDARDVPAFADMEPSNEIDAPSSTQAEIVRLMWHPRRILLNETFEAEYARYGIDVSYPYLDRDLVEFVTSIHPLNRPFDGSTKTLVRIGFADRLPESVLRKAAKTNAEAYLAAVFRRLAPDFKSRYPTVSAAAAPFIGKEAYTHAISGLEQGALLRSERRQLWDAWMLMLWLDSLSRY